MVKVRGERKSEHKTEKKDGFRSEFYYGEFERIMQMPARVDKERVSAEYKDGVLSLVMPKAQAEVKEAIKVKVA